MLFSPDSTLLLSRILLNRSSTGPLLLSPGVPTDRGDGVVGSGFLDSVRATYNGPAASSYFPSCPLPLLEKTKENAPPLVKQIWSFLGEQLEVAEKREMTVTRFVTAANEVTIGGFWREHAKGELKTRRDHEILEFLSPRWGKEFMAGVFDAKETIFGAFVQEILSMPISLLLALYLVYPRYLFNMVPAYMFSRGVETLRIDGYLALVLLTHGELVSFHRLTKYGEPLSMGKTH